jgi:GxxExxY protein
MSAEIVYKDEAYAIVGACFEVYNEMGCGFVEPVYQECLRMEFMARSLPFHPQRELALKYKGRLLDSLLSQLRPLFEAGI